MAALSAADRFPSAAWHAPITVVVIGVTPVITYAAQQRTRRNRLRYLSEMILYLRRRADAFERGATTNRLTRLLNRRTFYEALERANPSPVSSPDMEDTRSGGALLMIYLNDFKQINDRWVTTLAITRCNASLAFSGRRPETLAVVSVTLSFRIGAVLLDDHTSRDAALIAADLLLYVDKARHNKAAGAA